jgi:hypothetical protein
MSRTRCVIGLVTTLVVASGPAAAYADPVVPQPGGACTADLASAMTWLAQQNINLECSPQLNGGFQWQIVTADYPSSDRWLTYGPPLRLRGQGTRNFNLRSGDWAAAPLAPDSRCIAEQITVVSAGVVSSSQVSAAATGEQLSFEVLPNLFSITMKGYCLWTRVSD